LTHILQGAMTRRLTPRRLMPDFQEKLRWCDRVPVPITDTGGRGEYPQALERTVVKELGKMDP
jgi:hypothetical protein